MLKLYWQAQVNWGWLLPPLGVVLVAAFFWVPGRGPAPADSARALLPVFEYYLPLAAAFYLAGAPALDRDEGAAEVHLSYPVPPPLLLLSVSAVRWGAWLATAALAVGAAAVWAMPVHLADTAYLAQVTLPPALALSGAAVAGAALGRHEVGGFMAAGLWWALDAFAPGLFNRAFYLFRLSRPLAGLSPAVNTRNLWVAGALLWLLALWLSSRRERWIR